MHFQEDTRRELQAIAGGVKQDFIKAGANKAAKHMAKRTAKTIKAKLKRYGINICKGSPVNQSGSNVYFIEFSSGVHIRYESKAQAQAVAAAVADAIQY